MPAYVWLMNEGDRTDRLVGASSPNAESVGIVDADGKTLPDGVEPRRTSCSNWSRPTTTCSCGTYAEVVRGGDFMKITLNLRRRAPSPSTSSRRSRSTTQALPPASEARPPPRAGTE
ncbi:copper chaperone PCu(A)C [Streptomyces thinghirensis]|nr:copper chaperone PCu(A)C [Streptomyces thinghirensis]